MKNNNKMFLSFLVVISIYILIVAFSFGDTSIRLVVDGKDITDLSNPIIENDRMLIPIRFVSEELGAEVIWDGEKRTVFIKRNNQNLLLKIDSRIVNYNDKELYQISDIAPKIINDRTYVPVRLVSNALGVSIEWDNETRTAIVDSKKESKIIPFYDIEFDKTSSLNEINAKREIKINNIEKYQEDNYIMKLLVINPETKKGYVVDRVSVSENKLVYIPRIDDNGSKLLVVGVYDENNKWVAGDIIKTEINVKPVIELTDINIIDNEKIVINPNINFLAKYVSYEFENLDDGIITEINERDPYDSYTWYPSGLGITKYNVVAKVSDFNNNVYTSKPYEVTVNIPKKLSLIGVNNGMTISGSDALIASRNFDVLETTYTIKDAITGKEEILATIPYGSYKWEPSIEDVGEKLLKVSVKDTANKLYESEWVSVFVDFSPYIKIKGVAPNQVITSEFNVSFQSNMVLEDVYYIFNDYDSNRERIIKDNVDETGFLFIPKKEDIGRASFTAYGRYNGEVLSSETIFFDIYLGELYSAKPIVEKDKFLDLAKELAIESYQKTDMSAALQTAQAILETGWGQSIPVDKYTDKFSYNLFGIKGKGTNGSVVSNTWEVYNGVVYRVDGTFRAYNNTYESWQDHKRILLELSRYDIFRDVMYDYTLGAWSIRRAGYATDPKYPIKLMRIIEEYDLRQLDQVDL